MYVIGKWQFPEATDTVICATGDATATLRTYDLKWDPDLVIAEGPGRSAYINLTPEVARAIIAALEPIAAKEQV